MMEELAALCRVCGSGTAGMTALPIFSAAETSSSSLASSLHDKMRACLPVRVALEDQLPQLLCGECVSKINLFYEFRQLSVKTDKLFKSMLSAKKQLHMETCIKSEQIETTPSGSLGSRESPQTPGSRPVRAVRLQQEISRASDSILESLLGKSSKRKSTRRSAKRRSTILRQCKYCKVVLPSRELCTHLAEEHKKQFECGVCRNRFCSSEELQEHHELEDHSPGEPQSPVRLLQCSECHKTYTRRHLLILHIRRHTGERPFPCSQCDKRYACKSSLNSHLLKHKEEWKHVCSFCGKGFVDKHSFVYHVRSNHTGERPFACSGCDKRFIKKQDLVKHEQTQHAETPQQQLACDSCGRMCKDYDALRSHRRSHIPVEQRRVHKCTLCEASFTGKTGLTKHMLRHTGVMPYECVQCAKRFYTKKGFDLHLVIHSGVKGFICEFCGKAFSQDNTLRVHRRTHTGERPYECTTCLKRFTQSSALNSHRKLHKKDKFSN